MAAIGATAYIERVSQTYAKWFVVDAPFLGYQTELKVSDAGIAEIDLSSYTGGTLYWWDTRFADTSGLF